MSSFKNKTRLCLRLAGLCLAGAAGTAFAADITAIEAQAETSVTWSKVSLTSDGSADWAVTIPANEAVDTYEIKLARQRDGVWDENYKTYKTTDGSYSFNFTSKAKYRYKVRIKFIGGAYSTWSQDSNVVNVTSDDLDDSGPIHSTGGYDYFNPPFAYGPGDVIPNTYYPTYGSGNSGYNTQSTVINTVTGETAYNNPNGSYPTGNPANTGTPGYNYTNPTGVSGFRNVNGRYMYIYANGTYLTNSWDRIDGSWYYFDQNGFMHTGWLFLNNIWYYCLPSGKMAESSWNNINEKWYYFNESGIMLTGYIQIDGKTYYTDGSGARVQSAYNPDGHLFDLNGVMIS